jgi:hypothetical protein
MGYRKHKYLSLNFFNRTLPWDTQHQQILVSLAIVTAYRKLQVIFILPIAVLQCHSYDYMCVYGSSKQLLEILSREGVTIDGVLDLMLDLLTTLTQNL